jgi:hypothetical protein
MAGCKCPGSCACKIKKPRKPKVKKAVVGGRVKQPQIIIQGMPPVSTTPIPAGYPTLTVTSDVDYTKPFKTKERVKSVSTQTETILTSKPIAKIQGRMTTKTQTNMVPKKETKEMGTDTEPLLVNVAKGAKQDIFSLMKEQEATGKTLSLTGSGRPARQFNESIFMASPSLSPVAPIVSAVPSIQSKLTSFFKKETK